MGQRQKIKQPTTSPFYKKRWFIGLTSVLGVAATLTGIWRLLFPALPTPPPPAVYENIELVLDGSSGMNQPFDGTSKLKAAADAVRTVLRKEGIERENLALRVFGGPCEANATEPTLRFSAQNEGPISNALQGLKAQGEAPLIRAVLQAITDFGDLSRFKDKSKRIIVITGTATGDDKKDGCGMPVESIQQKLNRQDPTSKQIEFDFHFIGVGLNDAGKSYLGSFASRIGGRADFADNRQQLQDLLSNVVLADNRQSPQDVPGSVVERESVLQSGKAVLDNLNASVDRMNLVINDLNQRDYKAGDRDLEQARIEFRRTEPAFENLGKRQTSEQYRRIYDAANKNRTIIDQLISVTATMLSQGKANDRDAFSASVAKFQSLKADYNYRIDDLDRQLTQLGSGER